MDSFEVGPHSFFLQRSPSCRATARSATTSRHFRPVLRLFFFGQRGGCNGIFKCHEITSTNGNGTAQRNISVEIEETQPRNQTDRGQLLNRQVKPRTTEMGNDGCDNPRTITPSELHRKCSRTRNPASWHASLGPPEDRTQGTTIQVCSAIDDLQNVSSERVSGTSMTLLLRCQISGQLSTVGSDRANLAEIGSFN